MYMCVKEELRLSRKLIIIFATTPSIDNQHRGLVCHCVIVSLVSLFPPLSRLDYPAHFPFVHCQAK